LTAIGPRAGAASSNTVTLASDGDRTIAFVADADGRQVFTFDVDSASSIASTPLDAAPSGVVALPNGTIAALGGDDARVHVLGVSRVDQPLIELGARVVAAEPVSAVVSADGARLLVVSRW
jgi:hypothetical protein